MSQIGISFEKTAICLALVNRGESGWYHVQECSELAFNADLYVDLLDKGHPKLVSEVTQKLTQLLTKLSPQKVAVCLNLTGIKALPIQLEKQLDAEIFEEECRHEAALFLREPDDYVWQSVQVSSAQPDRFDRYVLLFMPARYLTRLKVLLLPTRKAINLIDVAHISLHHLQLNPQTRAAILELEPNYVALSTMLMPNFETFSFTPLNADTDLAYFALSAIQQLPSPCPISVVGSAATQETISFIAQATGLTILHASLPKNFVVSAQVGEPETYLKAISCAVKAMSLPS
ncbi:MAG: hypothetical protein RMI34_07105 [Chloroherpetonaceae bacterium]|nr:hypothetical protein [Chloroherpetonaceae bacterium]MDW8019826.1 hypothetical protein [Chloroherpetonaceae bacterium]